MNEQVSKDYEEYKAQGRIWGIVPKEGYAKVKFPRISQEIIEQFKELEDVTGCVSDVLDSLGIKGVVAASHLKPSMSGKTIVGTAITIRSIPERKTATKGLHDKDFIKMASREVHYLAESGDIIVADFGGNPDISNMGGQSAAVAIGKGLVGAIVNGAVRDITSFTKNNFPVWSKGVTSITGKCRMQAIEVNGPVTVHDILVEAGDLVVADDSAVCIIPPEHVEYVLAECKKTVAKEDQMRELIVKDAPIEELQAIFRKRYE